MYNIYIYITNCLITENSLGLARTPDEFCYLLSTGQLKDEDNSYWDTIRGIY